MATTIGAVTLKVAPRDALVDTPVTITARGLAPGQPVTMVTRLADNGVFMAHAHYIAGPKGDLDLSRDISQEGTYTGKFKPFPIKHKALTHRCFIVGPPSSTSAQQ